MPRNMGCQSAALENKDEDNQWLPDLEQVIASPCSLWSVTQAETALASRFGTELLRLPVLIEDDGEVKKFPMLAEERKEKAQTDDANASPADKAKALLRDSHVAKGSRKAWLFLCQSSKPFVLVQLYPVRYEHSPEMPRDVQRCPEMRRDAQRCAEMRRDAQKCPECLSGLNFVGPVPARVGYPGYFGYPGYPGEQLGQLRQLSFQLLSLNLIEGYSPYQVYTQMAAAQNARVPRFHQNVLDPLAAAVNLKELANESERKKWAQAPVPLEYKVPA
eukprot:Skav201464  [mRNA]  locus=scaffold663:23482:30707:+ [translate_table: standard]